ncbi:MAG: GtrA family protein [Saprospiraceae bacterium]
MANSAYLKKYIVSDVPLVKSGFRWGFAAMAATTLDFTVLTTLTEVFEVYYVISTALGAFFGGTLSFLLGRNWAFFNRENNIFGQAGRYLVANFSSILFNTSGVYLLTEVISDNHYLVSKVIVASCIGFLFNFPMQRYFVFRKRD